MGEDEVHRLLRKIIKGRPFRNDVAEEGVVLLDEGLLGRAHRVAVEQGDFLLPLPVVLK